MKCRYIRILLLVTVALSGCVLPYDSPVRQIHYRVQLQKPVEIDYTSAVEFAVDFASKTGLGVTYVSPQTGNPYLDDDILIALGGMERITAAIIACKSTDTLDIVIHGDIDSPTAKVIAGRGLDLIHQKYPEAKIVEMAN